MFNKKVIAVFILVLVLALVISAFGDMTTAVKTSYLGEYWVVGMSVVVLGGVLVWLKMPEETKQMAKTTKKPKKITKRKK